MGVVLPSKPGIAWCSNGGNREKYVVNVIGIEKFIDRMINFCYVKAGQS
jgi:hypothetical protein